MTTAENIEKYQSAVRNWTVQNLKADKEFMAACRDDEDFKDYVLYHRPDMANDSRPKIKFLGLSHSKVPDEPESPQIEPEPVEELSNTQQIMKDLKAFRKKKGFI